LRYVISALLQSYQQGENQMTCTVTAMTNDNAKLVVKEARITYDQNAASALADIWECEGYFVRVTHED